MDIEESGGAFDSETARRAQRLSVAARRRARVDQAVVEVLRPEITFDEAERRLAAQPAWLRRAVIDEFKVMATRRQADWLA